MQHDAPPPGAPPHERTRDREQYRRVRDAFDDLKVEDQAVFLAEAAVGVVARGIEQAGHAVAEALDELLRTRPRDDAHRGTAQERTEEAAREAAREATGEKPPASRKPSPPEPPASPEPPHDPS